MEIPGIATYHPLNHVPWALFRIYICPRNIHKAIYFFERSVLFETGELNAYVYDGGGLYRRKNVRTEGKGRTTTITLADGKLLPCIATRV